MTSDTDDPVAELKKLMTEAVQGHHFDQTLAMFHAKFDAMSDELELTGAERLCICLANAYRMALEQEDHHLVEMLLRLLEPILPDGIGKD